jgi:hypothetical protein
MPWTGLQAEGTEHGQPNTPTPSRDHCRAASSDHLRAALRPQFVQPPSLRGQCGPPFQLQVIFRPGTSLPAAAARMKACAWKPFVTAVGPVRDFHGPALAEPPWSRIVMIYTQSMTSSRNLRLLNCPRRWRQVSSASYPD